MASEGYSLNLCNNSIKPHKWQQMWFLTVKCILIIWQWLTLWWSSWRGTGIFLHCTSYIKSVFSWHPYLTGMWQAATCMGPIPAFFMGMSAKISIWCFTDENYLMILTRRLLHNAILYLRKKSALWPGFGFYLLPQSSFIQYIRI